MAQDVYRSQFRLPQSLYEELKKAADENHRSLNAELVARLESTFEEGSLYGHQLSSAASALSALDLDELLDTVGGAMNTLQGVSEALYVAIRHAQRVERAEDRAAEQQGQGGPAEQQRQDTTGEQGKNDGKDNEELLTDC